MLVYVSYYTTSYTTTCGTFIDRFTVRKKKWGWFGLLVCLFSILIIKLAVFLFLFRVFIRTAVQPARLSPGSRMSVHPLPVLSENPSQPRIPLHPGSLHTQLLQHNAHSGSHTLRCSFCTLFPLTRRRRPRPPRRPTGTCRAGSGGSGRATSPPSG